MPFASLENRLAVVTGSSTGIGRAIALEFAAAGADVLVHCRSSLGDAKSVAEEIRDLGQRSTVIVAPLNDAAGRQTLLDEVDAAMSQPVDVWVNNAGADLLTGSGRNLEYADKLQRLWSVDVAGTVELSRAIGHQMKQRGRGVILNIGWDQAETGMEGDSGELFAAAKNAIMGFTRSLSLSLAPEVRVNCIAPGWIRTAWGETASEEWQDRVLQETPLKRWGEPTDIARLARFLASDDAAYLTGQIINANGGAIR